MAKLVIGSNKQNGIPAIVKEVVVQPSLGTKNITANGTYNASSDNYDGYSSVTVNVPTVSEPYLELEVNNGDLRHSQATSHLLPLSGFTGIDAHLLAYAYYYNTNISGAIVFSDLKWLAHEYSCLRTFAYTHASSFSAPQLTSVTAQSTCYGMFLGSRITSASLPSLTTISGDSALYECFRYSYVSSVDLSSLKTISGRYGLYTGFANCNYLTTMTFLALDVLTGYGALQRAFENSAVTSLSFPALKSDSFGSYTNQFNNMLSGVTGCTVHFPSNLQSVIGSWSDVTNGFGGTNTTVLFDLPQTE